MKEFKYEVLARLKTGNKVMTVYTNDKAEAAKKAKSAAKKGFPCLVISDKDGKRVGAKIGPDIDWSKYSRIVKVTFGSSSKEYTYLTHKTWEIGDTVSVWAPCDPEIIDVKISTASHYVYIDTIVELEDKYGELKVLDDIMVSDACGKYIKLFKQAKTLDELEKATNDMRSDNCLKEYEKDGLDVVSFGIYDSFEAASYRECW